MSPKLIYVPVHVATQVEDGLALAHRTWVVHPLKGLAFRLETSAQGTVRLAPLCAAHPLGAERLAREADRSHVTQLVPAVFLRHAEALVASWRVAPVPAPSPARRTERQALRLARIRALAA